jgi:hypothetical protein
VRRVENKTDAETAFAAKGKGKKGGKQKDYNAYSQKKEENFSKARRYKCNKCKEFGHTRKMEAICSSETSVETQQTTQHHIPPL